MATKLQFGNMVPSLANPQNSMAKIVTKAEQSAKMWARMMTWTQFKWKSWNSLLLRVIGLWLVQVWSSMSLLGVTLKRLTSLRLKASKRPSHVRWAVESLTRELVLLPKPTSQFKSQLRGLLRKPSPCQRRRRLSSLAQLLTVIWPMLPSATGSTQLLTVIILLLPSRNLVSADMAQVTGM